MCDDYPRGFVVFATHEVEESDRLFEGVLRGTVRIMTHPSLLRPESLDGELDGVRGGDRELHRMSLSWLVVMGVERYLARMRAMVRRQR